MELIFVTARHLGATGSTSRYSADVTAEAERAAAELTFRRLYEDTSRTLWRYLRKGVTSDAVADDLLQESYYRFVRSGFEGESHQHRRRFLFRTASNLLVDHYRRNRHPESELPADLPSRSGGPAPGLGRDVERAMRGLKLRQRQLLWLAHVEGFSHREIAEVLGIKEGSVRPMLFRARRRLGELLEASGLGPEVLG